MPKTHIGTGTENGDRSNLGLYELSLGSAEGSRSHRPKLQLGEQDTAAQRAAKVTHVLRGALLPGRINLTV